MWRTIFIDSWWVWAFALICGCLYERGMESMQEDFQKLGIHLSMLEEEKQKALQKQERLQRQIDSQSDLAWLELTLMKGLGLCPEDQRKVYFEDRCCNIHH